MPKTTNLVSLNSNLETEDESHLIQNKVNLFKDSGPRPFSTANPSLKRKSEFPLQPPKFRRGFVWTDITPNDLSPSAINTEIAPPLPTPPLHLLNDPQIQSSLHSLRDYIKVETPFNIDKFELLLTDHPNRPFVQSVMRGLREGFWPFDEGEWSEENQEYPKNYSSDPEDVAQIRAFRDKEVGLERWSNALESSNLLPGMKVSPLFVIWQNSKPRVITDHSGSGINDGIPQVEGKVKYDDMRTFSQTLHYARKSNPGRKIITFKSDVASAFLNLPAHPIFQLRQIVCIDEHFYIVRRLVFGNRASPRSWCAVSGLLCWLGVRKLNIPGLHVYMDDFFGWDFDDNLVRFRGKRQPVRQVQLLILWEHIACPFEDRKQEHGEVLKIIGFWVDANNGSISLPPNAISELIKSIDTFLATPNRSPPLRDWQRLAGHLNWLLNVLPWGRPALTELYRKMSGKTHRTSGIPLNAVVRSDLSWLKLIVPRSIGILFTDVGLWADNEADLVLWTDASLKTALSFVFANQGFIYSIQPPTEKIDIFFLELIAILSGIHHVATLNHPPKRVLLWSDSLNAVEVLNSLHATETIHNGPLLAIAEIILNSGLDFRIRHIDGKKNIRADMLSRLLLDDYHRKFPADRVHYFNPPRDLLPARWRKCF